MTNYLPSATTTAEMTKAIKMFKKMITHISKKFRVYQAKATQKKIKNIQNKYMKYMDKDQI